MPNYSELETTRLRLRSLRPSDAPEIFQLRSDLTHNRYIDRPLATSIADAHAFIQTMETLLANNESWFWVIAFKDNPQLAGTILLMNFDAKLKRAEVGYELLPAQQGKGIIAEALPAVLDFGFNTLRLSAITARTYRDNARSTAVLKKSGFKLDETAMTELPQDSVELLYRREASL